MNRPVNYYKEGKKLPVSFVADIKICVKHRKNICHNLYSFSNNNDTTKTTYVEFCIINKSVT